MIRPRYMVAFAVLLATIVAVTIVMYLVRVRREIELAQACTGFQSQAALFVGAELVAQGGDADLREAVRRAAQELGRSYFVCPKTGEPFRIQPDAEAWMRHHTGSIGMYCVCPDHLNKRSTLATDVRGNQLWIVSRLSIDWTEEAITVEARP